MGFRSGRRAAAFRGSFASAMLRRRMHIARQAVRPGIGVTFGRRGGFFKKLFKGIKKVVTTVAKVPVVSTIAKAAISSIPVVRAVSTAVSAVRKKTASGASRSGFAAVKGIMQREDAYEREARSQGLGRYAKKRRRKPTARTRARSGSSNKPRRGGVSAKQRAARARFARAARKGPIKKGAKL